VVDNGSTAGTRTAVDALRSGFPSDLRLVHEPAPGPASARNAGVAQAAGSLLLFLGDDTEPATDDLLARHVLAHDRRPEPGYAVLGRVKWDEARPVTPLMRWLDAGGWQFAFATMSRGPVSPACHLYSSHLSMKAELLESVGGFDGRFPYAAAEDMELGIRLEQAGAELEYLPELLVLHDHPITLIGSLERMGRVGRSAALLAALHPDTRHPGLRPPKGLRWPLARATRPLFVHLARARALREPAWRLLHLAAYSEGYRQGPPSSATQP